jgi:hypothetical protein
MSFDINSVGFVDGIVYIGLSEGKHYMYIPISQKNEKGIAVCVRDHLVAATEDAPGKSIVDGVEHIDLEGRTQFNAADHGILNSIVEAVEIAKKAYPAEIERLLGESPEQALEYVLAMNSKFQKTNITIEP